MMKVLKCLSCAIKNEKGQSMTEYGLIIALIAVVVITAIALLGDQISNAFMSIVNALK